MKINFFICTGLMLNDHSNPYIESITVLSDTSKRVAIFRLTILVWKSHVIINIHVHA